MFIPFALKNILVSGLFSGCRYRPIPVAWSIHLTVTDQANAVFRWHALMHAALAIFQDTQESEGAKLLI